MHQSFHLIDLYTPSRCKEHSVYHCSSHDPSVKRVIYFFYIGVWPSGKALDFDSKTAGSNPAIPAKLLRMNNTGQFISSTNEKNKYVYIIHTYLIFFACDIIAWIYFTTLDHFRLEFSLKM